MILFFRGKYIYNNKTRLRIKEELRDLEGGRGKGFDAPQILSERLNDSNKFEILEKLSAFEFTHACITGRWLLV